MELIIVGPGRAGMSLARAARTAGHDIVGVLGRTNVATAARSVDSRELDWERPLPSVDLIVVAVRDDALGEVAARLGLQSAPSVHLSGLARPDVLRPMGPAIGSFHPLQTLPDPAIGARALAGAYIAITATDSDLRRLLTGLATSIGATPFDLEEDSKELYHAGAASAANYLTTALALAEALFRRASVEFGVARPLVEQAVANAFDLGPAEALTGPIVRGDAGTVAAQLSAIRTLAPELAPTFVELARATARLAGTEDTMQEVLDGDR